MEVYSTLVSLQQDLDLILSSHHSSHHLLESGEFPYFEDLLQEVDKFFLSYSPRIGGDRDLVVSIKEDANRRNPLLCIHKIQKLYDTINSMVKDPLNSQTIESINLSINNQIIKGIELFFYHPVLQKLSHHVSLMNSLLKHYSGDGYITKFDNRIRDVACKAANQIHHYKVCERVLLQFDGCLRSQEVVCFNEEVQRKASLCQPFHQHLTLLSTITQEVVCINEELKRFRKTSMSAPIKQTQNLPETTGNSSAFLNPHKQIPKNDGKLVGIENDLTEMLNCLTKESWTFKVFTVVGMAGIGKTTFAKELYDNPLVIYHFHVRAWVTISQQYQVKGLLLELLRDIMNLSKEMYEMNEEELKEQLYRRLKGKRYFIIFDDAWDANAWNELIRVFPDDKNGSRVLLTSRLRDLALYTSPNVPPHVLHGLSPEESWELLCSKAFKDELCPLELLSIGKQIAKKCCELPLAIVVVGGLLSKMEKTENAWKRVAQDIGTRVMDETQCCRSILSLSYIHLPYPLKACFLYMGVFPEDYNISSKRLMCLWIAEEFVQPNVQKTLEETAQDYLEDLVARSLAMVRRKGSNGMIKMCHIHDLMRELCLRECRKDNFLQVICKYEETSMGNEDEIEPDLELLQGDMRNMQCLAFHSNFCLYLRKRASFPFTRSFFGFESLGPTDLKGCSGIFFKLLKILDIMHVHLFTFPQGLLFLPKLKYIALTIQNPLDSLDLFKLQKLQTCIIDGEWTSSLSKEFWDMSELRLIHLKRRLSNSTPNLTSNLRVLPNLQSLSTVGPECCSKEIFNSMPNLKKLGVFQTEDDVRFIDWFENLIYLTQLETFKYGFSNPFASFQVRPVRCPSNTVFPPNLMKLTLSGTSFLWEDMHQISMLPKLKVLKLKNYAFEGKVWDLEESVFSSLSFLQIGSTNLEVWKAEASNFPRLEHIVLRYCRYLEEIPSDIGNSPLKKIEVHCCADSAATSAWNLQEEQREYGYEELTVHVTKGWEIRDI